MRKSLKLVFHKGICDYTLASQPDIEILVALERSEDFELLHHTLPSWYFTAQLEISNFGIPPIYIDYVFSTFDDDLKFIYSNLDFFSLNFCCFVTSRKITYFTAFAFLTFFNLRLAKKVKW